jgi:hypothetical protein
VQARQLAREWADATLITRSLFEGGGAVRERTTAAYRGPRVRGQCNVVPTLSTPTSLGAAASARRAINPNFGGNDVSFSF